MRGHLRVATLIALLATSTALCAEEPTRVFAAASLTNALNDAALLWQRAGHAQPRIAYAASSVLAKQIDAGAPADVYASADISWMNYLDDRGRIVKSSRIDLLGNALVLIAPRDRTVAVEMHAGFDLAGSFSGKLCTGEPDVVPVGIYAKQSLERLGWWAALRGRIVGTEDVRTALAFVERGECALGIVYATDAAITDKVKIVGRFPADSHAPIVYPFALVKGARPQARAFLDYLATSPEAAAIYRKYAFTRVAE